MFRLAGGVTTPSRYLQDIFKRLGISATVIPNIIDATQFPNRVPLRGETTRFICTRQFEPYYDIATAVRAFRLVKNGLSNVTLLLIGEGSLQGEVETLVHQLGLGDAVTFAGKVKPGEIPAYLNRSDIFVNPSVVDNYPNSILEAFAAGVPVVTTSAGGIPYLVSNGRNGLMVEPGDPRAMAQAMMNLAKDPELCLTLLQSGKETADSHSWGSIWPLMKKAYRLC